MSYVLQNVSANIEFVFEQSVDLVVVCDVATHGFEIQVGVFELAADVLLLAVDCLHQTVEDLYLHVNVASALLHTFVHHLRLPQLNHFVFSAW